MPKICLRHDQSWSMVKSGLCDNSQMKIYAPAWVEEALVQLSPYLSGKQFDICEEHQKKKKLFSLRRRSSGLFKQYKLKKVASFETGKQLTLRDLQMIARNEPVNVSGVIQFHLFEPEVSKSVVFSLKDLVRHTVVVGLDQTTHYGGFPRDTELVVQEAPVYVCDLSGIQFRHNYNTGRLVLVSEKNQPHGVLDDFIFTKTVGQPKINFDLDYLQRNSNRYQELPHNPNDLSNRTFFDVFAYKKFVTQDVLLSGLAFCDKATSSGNELNFKFLKYGSGFFARIPGVKKIIEENILDAVIDGFELLFARTEGQIDLIRSVDLPYYRYSSEQERRLFNLCSKYNKKYSFSEEDVLKETVPGLVNAVTNCADPHAVAGNEMDRRSVDSAVAENLKSKAHFFSACLNRSIQEKYIVL